MFPLCAALGPVKKDGEVPNVHPNNVELSMPVHEPWPFSKSSEYTTDEIPVLQEIPKGSWISVLKLKGPDHELESPGPQIAFT